MATIPKQPIIAVRSQFGGPPTVVRLPEAATQTFKRGALLIFSAGYIQEAGADPANVLGIAAEDGHNAAAAGDSTIGVYLLRGTIFEANLGVAQTTAATDRGTSYGVVKDGDNWHIDQTEVSTVQFKVLELSRKDLVGDTNGRVLIVGLDAADQLYN